MFYRYHVPAFLWAVIILYVLCVPGSSLPNMPLFQFPQFDKIVHTSLFTILSLLLAFAFFRQQKYVWLRQYGFWVVLTVGIWYGGITELVQYAFVPTRDASWADFAANVAGCFGGVFAALLIKLLFRRPATN